MGLSFEIYNFFGKTIFIKFKNKNLIFVACRHFLNHFFENLLENINNIFFLKQFFEKLLKNQNIQILMFKNFLNRYYANLNFFIEKYFSLDIINFFYVTYKLDD